MARSTKSTITKVCAGLTAASAIVVSTSLFSLSGFGAFTPTIANAGISSSAYYPEPVCNLAALTAPLRSAPQTEEGTGSTAEPAATSSRPDASTPPSTAPTEAEINPASVPDTELSQVQENDPLLAGATYAAMEAPTPQASPIQSTGDDVVGPSSVVGDVGESETSPETPPASNPVPSEQNTNPEEEDIAPAEFTGTEEQLAAPEDPAMGPIADATQSEEPRLLLSGTSATPEPLNAPYGAPCAPTSLNFTTTPANGINQISWDQPNPDESVVSEYKIQVDDVSVNGRDITFLAPGDTRSYTMWGLAPEATVDVHVTARNYYNNYYADTNSYAIDRLGEATSSLNNQTTASNASGSSKIAPGAVVGLAQTADSNSITWQPPAEEGDEPIKGYIIYVDGAPYSIVDANTLTLDLGSLDVGAHTVAIKAYTEGLAGQTSSEETITIASVTFSVSYGAGTNQIKVDTSKGVQTFSPVLQGATKATFTAAGLPAGWSINQKTGVISSPIGADLTVSSVDLAENWMIMDSVSLPDGGAILVGYATSTVKVGGFTAQPSGTQSGIIGKVSATGSWEWLRPVTTTTGEIFLTDVSLSPDGKTIAIGGGNRTTTGSLVYNGNSRTLPGSNGSLLLAMDKDGTLKYLTALAGPYVAATVQANNDESALMAIGQISTGSLTVGASSCAVSGSNFRTALVRVSSTGTATLGYCDGPTSGANAAYTPGDFVSDGTYTYLSGASNDTNFSIGGSALPGKGSGINITFLLRMNPSTGAVSKVVSLAQTTISNGFSANGGLAVAPGGGVYVAGVIPSASTSYAGAPVTAIGAGQYQIGVARMNSELVASWARSMGSSIGAAQSTYMGSKSVRAGLNGDVFVGFRTPGDITIGGVSWTGASASNFAVPLVRINGADGSVLSASGAYSSSTQTSISGTPLGGGTVFAYTPYVAANSITLLDGAVYNKVGGNNTNLTFMVNATNFAYAKKPSSAYPRTISVAAVPQSGTAAAVDVVLSVVGAGAGNSD